MNMRKIAFILAVLLSFSAISVQAKTLEFTIGSENLYVSDGAIEAKTIDAKPYIENSRTMIPIRVVSENFGATVDWNADEQKVTISTDGTTIELVIGSDVATVNGEAKKLDTAPAIVDSRTMVPLRFVSENLGKYVDYVDLSKQILISDEKPVMTINDVNITLDDFRALAVYLGYEMDPTYADYLFGQLSSILLSMAIVVNEANVSGYTLTEEERTAIMDQITAVSDEVYADSLVAPIIKLLCNDAITAGYLGGILPDEYAENYVRAKHILILTVNMETGENYSAEELEEARKTIEDIKVRLDGGEDFDKLMKDYCEDPGVVSNPDGYVFTYNEMVPEFEKAAFALKEGEISDIVETAYGYHIIKKEPLPELDEATSNKITANVIGKLYEEYIISGLVEEHMTADEIVNLLFKDSLIEW